MDRVWLERAFIGAFTNLINTIIHPLSPYDYVRGSFPRFCPPRQVNLLLPYKVGPLLHCSLLTSTQAFSLQILLTDISFQLCGTEPLLVGTDSFCLAGCEFQSLLTREPHLDLTSIRATLHASFMIRASLNCFVQSSHSCSGAIHSFMRKCDHSLPYKGGLLASSTLLALTHTFSPRTLR